MPVFAAPSPSARVADPPRSPTMQTPGEVTMPTVSHERLAEVFVEVADTLVDDFDLIEFLRTVTARAAELVNVAAVGLLLADTHGQLHVMAASDEQTRLLELLQLQHREGPCLEAFLSGAPVVNADLAATPAWGSAPSTPFRCACAPASSGLSTCSAPAPRPWTPGTCGSSRPSPTSPRSPCCRSRLSTAPRSSPSSSREHSTAGS